MVSHQELLKEDLIAEEYKSRQAQDPKSQEEIILDDKTSRVKRPRLLGPILAARFGVPSTHLGTRDETIKPRSVKGNINTGRVVPDNSASGKQPRYSGVFHHSGLGVLSTHPSSSSSAP